MLKRIIKYTLDAYKYCDTKTDSAIFMLIPLSLMSILAFTTITIISFIVWDMSILQNGTAFRLGLLGILSIFSPHIAYYLRNSND